MALSVPTRPVLTLEMCKIILEACEAKARELRTSVIIAIVDAGGNLKAFHDMDCQPGKGGSYYSHIEYCINKAWTAASRGRATPEIFEENRKDIARLIYLSRVPRMAFSGGFPIYYKGEVIGGLGVNGKGLNKDTPIGEAGLKKLEEALE